MSLQKLKIMEEKITGSLADRIFSELEMVLQYNKYNNNEYTPIIDECIEYLYNKFEKNNGLTIKDVHHVENKMMFLKPMIKSFEVLCVGHAHLDMNWLWGIDETVSIVIATMETTLHLLDTYKDFTFAQSQASVYKILEKYRPDLLKRIKKYVKQGRFEVSAGAWVECDKNIPNAASLVSQIQETKNYLSQILSINKDSINIDFEPDTFGHSIDVPEILYQNGIKYYYHCRGNNNDAVYRWESKANHQILVYREPKWYNSNIDHHSFDHVIDFAYKHNIKKVLKVFGVGDHGGGATIADIETIHTMANYPLMPTIRFGSYHEYFEYLNQFQHWPIYKEESNFIFRGCYSSQSEIKKNNAIAEINCFKAGFYQSVSNSYSTLDLLKEAKEKLLFNQFHDILPGSGKEATRIHALAQYQEVNALTGTVLTTSLQNIIKNIDTSFLFDDDELEDNNTSFGAGNGYHANEGHFLNSKAYSKQRAYVIFNPTSFQGTQLVKLDLWDFNHNIDDITIYDENKKPLNFYVKPNSDFYWTHNVHTIECEVELKPFGYSLVILKLKPAMVKEITYPPMYERVENKDDFKLENDFVRIQLDKNLNIIEFFDKIHDKILINKKTNLVYSLEDGEKLMSAWVSGRIDQAFPLDRNINVKSVIHNHVKDEIIYEVKFGNHSSIAMTLSLQRCDAKLSVHGECLFYEKGEFGLTIPRLEYQINPSENLKTHKFITQLGTITRSLTDEDMPSQQGIYVGDESSGLLITALGKYGYRCNKNDINVVLLRASFDPDKIPEYGERSFDIYLTPIKNDDACICKTNLNTLIKPIVSTISCQKGNKLDKTFITIDDELTLLNAYLDKENKINMIIKNDSNHDVDGVITLNFLNEIKCCHALNDDVHVSVDKNSISMKIQNNSLVHLIIK